MLEWANGKSEKDDYSDIIILTIWKSHLLKGLVFFAFF